MNNLTSAILYYYSCSADLYDWCEASVFSGACVTGFLDISVLTDSNVCPWSQGRLKHHITTCTNQLMIVHTVEPSIMDTLKNRNWQLVLTVFTHNYSPCSLRLK